MSTKEAIGIEYSPMCKRSFPCQHSNVTILYNDGSKENVGNMNGREIAHLFQKHNLPVDVHFAGYLVSGVLLC